ncbi:MAG: hypothetical protein ABFD84_03225 [Candidatus Polarisedimenticolia bacterium]|nr:hypothetical protein [bacterium]
MRGIEELKSWGRRLSPWGLAAYCVWNAEKVLPVVETFGTKEARETVTATMPLLWAAVLSWGAAEGGASLPDVYSMPEVLASPDSDGPLASQPSMMALGAVQAAIDAVRGRSDEWVEEELGDSYSQTLGVARHLDSIDRSLSPSDAGPLEAMEHEAQGEGSRLLEGKDAAGPAVVETLRAIARRMAGQYAAASAAFQEDQRERGIFPCEDSGL